MNDYITRLVLAGIVAAIVVGGGNAKADYTLGKPSYLDEPVSSSSWEYSVCISPDGRELFFSSGGIYGWHDLFVVVRQSPNDPWRNKTNLGEHINSSAPDVFPSISADGLSLYFAQGTTNSSTIWVTTRTTLEDPWGPATKLGSAINKGSASGTPAISADGLSLYFSRKEAGNIDLYVSTRSTAADEWGEAVPLPSHINTQYDEIDPFVTPDGRCLLFCSTPRNFGGNDEPRPDGVGQADVWMAKRSSTSDEWGQPVFLPVPINTIHNEVGVCISWDSSTLYFCSDRGDDFPSYGVYQAPILPVIDLNGDGIVDSADMCIIVNHWGEDYPLCDIGPTPLGDGIVDVQDLIVLAEHLFEVHRLIHHWTLDETGGGTAYDSVGDKDAVLHGGPLWQPTAGRIEGALAFDGENDYLTTPFILNPAAGSFGAFAWIKGTERGRAIVSQNDSSGFSQLWLGTDASGGRLITRLMHPPFTPLMSEAIITDGQWHHVGVVFDIDKLHRYLYVDGTKVAEDIDFASGVSLDGGLFISVGEGINLATCWSGLIDDVRIYGNALSEEAVAALAQ